VHDRSYKQQQTAVTRRQAELRAHYARNALDAIVLKRAQTRRADGRDPLHGSVIPVNTADGASPYGAAWDYGIDRAVGGMHDAPNPAEMLCAALAACADASIRMCAEARRVRLERLEVEVCGRLDVRGALGRQEVPVGFLGLQVLVRLRAAPGTQPARIERLLAAAESTCVVLATLRRGVAVDVDLVSEPLAPSAVLHD
jgi:uncharacterized OsmC-like protein